MTQLHEKTRLSRPAPTMPPYPFGDLGKYDRRSGVSYAQRCLRVLDRECKNLSEKGEDLVMFQIEAESLSPSLFREGLLGALGVAMSAIEAAEGKVRQLTRQIDQAREKAARERESRFSRAHALRLEAERLEREGEKEHARLSAYADQLAESRRAHDTQTLHDARFT